MTRRGVLVRVSVLVLTIAAFILIETQVGISSRVDVRGYFRDLGWIALPAFAVFYAAATLLPLPKAVFTIAGGAVFGFWVGLGVVLVGAVVGSTGAFAGARWLGRSSVREMAADRVRRLDEQIGRRGFMTVLVARLVPVVPFTTINYVFGLTAVTLRSYIGATAIGIVPGTAVYIAVGAYGFSPGSWPFVIAVLGVIVLSILGVLHQRRNRAEKTITPGEPGDAARPGP